MNDYEKRLRVVLRSMEAMLSEGIDFNAVDIANVFKQPELMAEILLEEKLIHTAEALRDYLRSS